MNAMYRRLKKAFPFVGKRAVTEDDLLHLCAAGEIPVIYDPKVEKGIYAECRDEWGRRHAHGIFLNPKLVGWSLVYVFAHEVAHFLFHAPTRTRCSRSGGGCSDPTHAEAENAAALLLLPLHDVEDALLHGLHLTDERFAELIGRRLAFASDYKR